MVCFSGKTWSAAERKAWSPPPDLNVSDHADRVRYVPYGPEPGPWRTSRVPYTREIMNSYSDFEVEKITVMGPAQCSKTESVFNMLNYTVDVDPVPSMYVIAVDDEIETISTDRILKNFQSSPELSVHLSGRAWDTKQSVIRFDRMPLYFTGAGSASALASKAIGRLVLDETDKYPDFVGAEGHPAKLAERRGSTYGDFKVVYLCTPTTKTGFIFVSWNRSNRMKYHVPCLRCGRYQILQFGRLKPNDPGQRDPDKILSVGVHYECEHCGQWIHEEEHPHLIQEGRWCPEGCTVDPGGELIGTPLRSRRHSGFWITELISPWLGWSKMLAEWFEINAAGLEKQSLLKEYVNQVLGGTFEEPGLKVDIERVRKKIIPLSPRAVPVGAKLLVSAADYHMDMHGNERVDFGVMSVSPGFRLHGVLIDSTTSLEDYYRQVLAMPFPWSEAGCPDEELAVGTAFVDSGFESDTVYEWCRQYMGICYPIKGVPTLRQPYKRRPVDEILETARDPHRKRKSRFFKGLDLIEISPDYFKDRAVNLLAPEPGMDRGLTLHEGTPEWFLEEVVNEHKVKIRKGRSYEHTWVPIRTGLPVHGWDVLVYMICALYFNKANILYDQPAELRPAAARQQRQRTKLSELPRRRL